MTVEATVLWVEDRRFVGHATSGHAIVVDASTEKRGPSPMELLLIGLAGCTASDVVEILEKKRQQMTGLEVLVRAERASEHPKVYTAIDVQYVVRGRGLKVKPVEDSIRLSEQKYCSAAAMLGKTAKITTNFRIVEEG